MENMSKTRGILYYRGDDTELKEMSDWDEDIFGPQHIWVDGRLDSSHPDVLGIIARYSFRKGKVSVFDPNESK